MSRNGKAEAWRRVEAFFAGGYSSNDEYGYGTLNIPSPGSLSFVFTFSADTKQFVMVNTTSAVGFDVSKCQNKYKRLFNLISSRFLVPNSVCLPERHATNHHAAAGAGEKAAKLDPSPSLSDKGYASAQHHI